MYAGGGIVKNKGLPHFDFFHFSRRFMTNTAQPIHFT
jgi:hypothetical protein